MPVASYQTLLKATGQTKTFKLELAEEPEVEKSEYKLKQEISMRNEGQAYMLAESQSFVYPQPPPSLS